MRAMVLETPKTPLKLVERPDPIAGPGEVVVKVAACGVCRTDLHVVDGELTEPKLPLIPGHEVIGTVAVVGEGVTSLTLGQRVGVPWLGHTCGHCDYCEDGQENLCDHPEFTGYTRDGGFASHVVADAAYCFPVSGNLPDVQAAPLMCAGLIGYRTYRIARETLAEAGGKAATRKGPIGIYGFGAAAHITAQIACHEGREVYAFTRGGDTAAQTFARDMGCVWAGGSDEPSPVKLDAALIFAPVGALVPSALRDVRKGGVVVCGGIHMSDIPSFPYKDLWEERIIRSVANLTRQDAIEFLELAPKAGVRTTVVEYPLEKANEALADLRDGRLQGAAVLVM